MRAVRWVERAHGLSRFEVFSLEGREYVRVSRDAFDATRGDVAVPMKTPGVAPLLLRPRGRA